MHRAHQDLSGKLFGYTLIAFKTNRRGFQSDFEVFWVIFDHFGGQGGAANNFKPMECIELVEIHLESWLVTVE